MIFIKLFIAVILTGILWYTYCSVVYRVPKSGKTKFTGEVVYKMAEVESSNRQLFESFSKRRPIRLQDQPLLFVSEDDYQKLWPKSPHDLKEENVTIHAELEAKPLLFGGYSKATVVSAVEVQSQPKLIK